MQLVVGSLLAALVLFANWVVLSGKFDAAHLGAGAVTAVVVAVTTWRLWTLPPALGASLVAPLHGIRWWRAIGYACRLAWDVALSAVQIAYVVLHPRMPIARGWSASRPRSRTRWRVSRWPTPSRSRPARSRSRSTATSSWCTR
jgi:multisubunit Na+/H+ antiporter MnhE subunit